MARPKKSLKVKEPIRIRERKLADGNISLYLDIYVKGTRKYESLGLYLIPESLPNAKAANARTRSIAEKIKSDRIIALQDRGIKQWDKIKRSNMSLIEWLMQYEQDSFGFKPSTLKGRMDMRKKVEEYLEQKGLSYIGMNEIDQDFCRGFLRFLEKICDRLKLPNRQLPGGYLYFTDILSDPNLVSSMGRIFAQNYYDEQIDLILTMETKGIPVALMTAKSLHVPLVIARRSSKVYEGSAVNINYVSGNGSIETMSISRRAIKEGSTALIVDDFMRAGGTAAGMLSLLSEFNVKCAGMCFVMATENANKKYTNSKPLLIVKDIKDDEPINIKVADWVK